MSATIIHSRERGRNLPLKETHYRVVMLNGDVTYLVPEGYDWNCEGGHDIAFFAPEDYANNFTPISEEDRSQLSDDIALTAPPVERPAYIRLA